MKSSHVNPKESPVDSGAEQQQNAASRIDLIERRRVPRALPRPEAVELDMDTGWAMWQQSVGAMVASAG